MNDNTAYNITETSKISLNKMNFDVINLHPKYSHTNAETAKSEIETKLFTLKNKVANKDNIRYTNIIKEYLKLKKPSKKLLSSLISKIEIDEEQNVNIFYKIKPLY